MKLKKIKNYILTFIICLFGAFAFNSIETKAYYYDNNTNNYVSSNIVDPNDLVVGNIATEGEFENSNYRLRTSLIEVDINDPMSRIVYVKIYNMGLCNNFVGARFAIHGYTDFDTSSHVFDSGWKSISNGYSNYVDLPSNVTHIAFLISFSSTSSNVQSQVNEITSLSMNQVRCIQFFAGHYPINSGGSFEPFGMVYSYGSMFDTCMVKNATTNLFNCTSFVTYDSLGPSYSFNAIKTQLQYNNLNLTGYYYVLNTYKVIDTYNLGMYIDVVNNSNASIEFLYQGVSQGGFNLNSSKYIDLRTLSNTYFDEIRIYNYNIASSVNSIKFIDYDLIDSIANRYYELGYNDGSTTSNTLVGMVGAIFTGPVTMFQQIFNFNVLGINFAEMLLGLVTLLVVIWLIKRFI